MSCESTTLSSAREIRDKLCSQGEPPQMLKISSSRPIEVCNFCVLQARTTKIEVQRLRAWSTASLRTISVLSDSRGCCSHRAQGLSWNQSPDPNPGRLGSEGAETWTIQATSSCH